MSRMQWDSADVTIVMAGSVPAPAEQPHRSANAVGDSSSVFPDIAGNSATPVHATPVPQQSLPPLATQASNLFQAAVAFVGDGCGIVDDATYRQRLEICRTCDRCTGNRCAACGCWINVKARGRIFRCPIGRWE